MAAARIEATVTMKNIYEYQRVAYAAWQGTETAYIYSMEAEDGTQYVWKTTSFMVLEVPAKDPKNANFYNRKGEAIDHEKINRGDVIRIKGSIKGQGEYKGQPQTELTRVKVVDRLHASSEDFAAKRKADREAKKANQLASIGVNDLVWRMPYKQYKERYSDCETVIDSFERDEYDGSSTIAVIIREGRLKASGVRGQHYAGYQMTNEEGTKVVYYAISEETATKRANKEYPGHDWYCSQVFQYMSRY